jgi:hypothetical protein
MKPKDLILYASLAITLGLLFFKWKNDPIIDSSSATRDSLRIESAAKDRLVGQWQHWSDSVLHRADSISKSRDRERITGNAATYIDAHGLDTISHLLTRRK